MGRKVKIRLSFANDATYLSRLVQAIEADSTRDMEWKRKAIYHIKNVIVLFMGPLVEDEEGA